MTPRFRSLALFTEDPDLVPSTQTELICNSFRGSDTLFWPPLALHTHSAHTCTHSGSHMHKIKTNLSFLSRKRTEEKSQVGEHLPSLHVHEAVGFVTVRP